MNSNQKLSKRADQKSFFDIARSNCEEGSAEQIEWIEYVNSLEAYLIATGDSKNVIQASCKLVQSSDLPLPLKTHFRGVGLLIDSEQSDFENMLLELDSTVQNEYAEDPEILTRVKNLANALRALKNNESSLQVPAELPLNARMVIQHILSLQEEGLFQERVETKLKKQLLHPSYSGVVTAMPTPSRVTQKPLPTPTPDVPSTLPPIPIKSEVVVERNDDTVAEREDDTVIDAVPQPVDSDATIVTLNRGEGTKPALRSISSEPKRVQRPSAAVDPKAKTEERSAIKNLRPDSSMLLNTSGLKQAKVKRGWFEKISDSCEWWSKKAIHQLRHHEEYTLNEAIKKDDLSVLNHMLEMGEFDPDTPDTFGMLPLMFAVNEKNYQAVKILLEHGADPNFHNEHGVTPLMSAAFWNEPKIVGLLIEHKAMVQIADSDGRTALKIAQEYHYDEIVRLLAPHYKDPKIQALVKERAEDRTVRIGTRTQNDLIKESERMKTGTFQAIKKQERPKRLSTQAFDKCLSVFEVALRHRRKIGLTLGLAAALGGAGIVYNKHINSRRYVIERATEYLQNNDADALEALMVKILRLENLTSDDSLLKIKCKISVKDYMGADEIATSVYSRNRSNTSLQEGLFKIYRKSNQIDRLRFIAAKSRDLMDEGVTHLDDLLKKVQ